MAIVVRKQVGMNAQRGNENLIDLQSNSSFSNYNFYNAVMPEGEGWHKFDWGGGQSNRTETGIHIYDSPYHGLKVGDKVQIQNCETNIPEINGIHTVSGLGTDEGGSLKTMFRIAVAKPEGKEVLEGYYRKVIIDGNAEDSVGGGVTTKSGLNTKTLWIGGISLIVIGTVVAILIKKYR